MDIPAAAERGVVVVQADFTHPRFRVPGMGEGVTELAWGLLMATVRSVEAWLAGGSVRAFNPEALAR